MVAEVRKVDPAFVRLAAAHIAAAQAAADALDGEPDRPAPLLREFRLLVSEVVKVAEARRVEREVAAADEDASWQARFDAMVEAERSAVDG